MQLRALYVDQARPFSELYNVYILGFIKTNQQFTESDHATCS